jgi:hypothetical protein
VLIYVLTEHLHACTGENTIYRINCPSFTVEIVKIESAETIDNLNVKFLQRRVPAGLCKKNPAKFGDLVGVYRD